jgi:hypothetical protein
MRRKDRYLIISLILGLYNLRAQAPISYKGLIKLPGELYATDGRSLVKGEYEMEVKPERERYVLLLSQKDKVQASVTGEMVRTESTELGAATPWTGTHFLRASTELAGTEAERHYSKTGRTQYEEEKRSWKAAMRTFTFPDDNVLFLFSEKRERV